MSWLVFTLLAALMWTMHMCAAKFVTAKIFPLFAATVMTFFSLATLSVLCLIQGQKFSVSADPKLFAGLIAAGVTIGLADYFVMVSLMKGAPLSLGTPIFSTVGLMLIALCGIVFFGEHLTPVKSAGFVLALAGIVLMAR